MENLRISRREACEILSISTETASKWIKLGKLKMNDDKTFDKEYVERLAEENKTGSLLKSRLNKRLKDAVEIYGGYINSYKNREEVKRLLNDTDIMSLDEIRNVLAYFARRLYTKTEQSNPEVFEALISELTKNSVNSFCNNFNIDLEFTPFDDTLGFVYISLLQFSNKKSKGMFFTPNRIADDIIDDLNSITDLQNKTICDPCCGSGNFLLRLMKNDLSLNHIFGFDIDEISVALAKISLFLNDTNLTSEQLNSHIKCLDSLTELYNNFDVIIGNPPWGGSYDKKYRKAVRKSFLVAKRNGFDTFDLFIEKAIAMINKDGFLAYILPESLMNVSSHQKARELILNNASFKSVHYFGQTLKGSTSPVVALTLQKCDCDSTKNCRIKTKSNSFVIGSNRRIDSSNFNLNITDFEYEYLEQINSIKEPVFLKNNAVFAVGIITGNNKSYIKSERLPDTEPILKGTDIGKYTINEAHAFVHYDRSIFQQSAPPETYRAKEKILYRYISSTPVFAYDDRQMLPLNSCNVLIPQIDGLDIKYILAILNSSVAEFFFSKTFNSVKMLKSHIEALPIPVPTVQQHAKIISLVDEILDNPTEATIIQNELNSIVEKLYNLA